MKTKRFYCCSLMVCFTLLAHSQDTSMSGNYNHRLYYTAPARIWEETLPLGNGRLGMMPDGGIEKERIVLNEISMWSGMEANYGNPEASKSLPAIQQLLFEGKNKAAQDIMYKNFVPKQPEAGRTYGNYQMLANLDILYSYSAEALKKQSPNKEQQSTDATTYRRRLDLQDGVAYTEFVQSGVTFRREYFVCRDKDVMLIHLTADSKNALNFTAGLNRPERGVLSIEDGMLLLSGALDSGKPGKEGMKYRVAMRLFAKGGVQEISPEKGISLSNGQEAWLVLSATTSYAATGTTFAGEHYEAVCDSLIKSIRPFKEELKARHTKTHRALYNRVSLTLPATADDMLPTNKRIERFAQAESPALAALYYNYGRYLFISSTRPFSLPPNLQGLWANGVKTPWNGDYHTNINLQMNYWIVEQAGLKEFYQPLIALIERLLPSATETARSFYGSKAEGWVLHMKTNVWNYTAPGEHPSWGATNTGGAWLCAHLWEHYTYTRDVDYLKQIYPILKGAAQFFCSTTVEEPQNGWLVTAPTSSPENSFRMNGNKAGISVCMGPTMDVQLLTELYSNVIEAAAILNRDTAFSARLKRGVQRFPPMQISPKGYLQEWLEDYEETDIHHRHVSHLYGLHPGCQISPEHTPALAEACRATLDRRGDDGSGWSRAWKINFWARLGDGNRAWQLFKKLLQPAVDEQTGDHRSGTYPNLLCSHSPFQIDGNFGGAAGIGEMLLQSHDGFIHVLPALPDAWHTGSFQNISVRGGATVSLEWEGGRAKRLIITATTSGDFKIKMPAGARLATVVERRKSTTYTDKIFTHHLQAGKSCTLVFEP